MPVVHLLLQLSKFEHVPLVVGAQVSPVHGGPVDALPRLWLDAGVAPPPSATAAAAVAGPAGAGVSAAAAGGPEGAEVHPSLVAAELFQDD